MACGGWCASTIRRRRQRGALRRATHRAIKKVQEDLEALALQHRDRGVDDSSERHSPARAAGSWDRRDVAAHGRAVRAAHLRGAVGGARHTIERSSRPRWPAFDPALTVEDTVVIAVQVNGKVRGRIDVARDASDDGGAGRGVGRPDCASAPRRQADPPPRRGPGRSGESGRLIVRARRCSLPAWLLAGCGYHVLASSVRPSRGCALAQRRQIDNRSREHGLEKTPGRSRSSARCYMRRHFRWWRIPAAATRRSAARFARCTCGRWRSTPMTRRCSTRSRWSWT